MFVNWGGGDSTCVCVCVCVQIGNTRQMNKKEVDDVMGREEDWDNVERTEGAHLVLIPRSVAAVVVQATRTWLDVMCLVSLIALDSLGAAEFATTNSDSNLCRWFFCCFWFFFTHLFHRLS